MVRGNRRGETKVIPACGLIDASRAMLVDLVRVGGVVAKRRLDLLDRQCGDGAQLGQRGCAVEFDGLALNGVQRGNHLPRIRLITPPGWWVLARAG